MQRAISDVRWGKAQAYEKGFWSRESAKTGGMSRFEWYEDRARRVWERVKPLLGSGELRSILEIGPGPVGIVNYLEAGERHALDPLEDYYCTQPEFVRVRDRGVVRHAGTGEDVLALNRTFSLVILDNVLDHMKDPGLVLRSIHRSLDPGGIMFISLNIYTKFGALLRNTMEYLEIDKGHPFNFSRAPVVGLLRKSGFRVLWSETEDYGAQKRRYRSSGQFKKVFKSCLGVVDFRFTALCRKV